MVSVARKYIVYLPTATYYHYHLRLYSKFGFFMLTVNGYMVLYFLL